MAILIDGSKKVLVQGITGREGMARTRLMLDYGTRVVAGCTPGKGGSEALGLPVYDTVEEAIEEKGGFDVSAIFVPAPLVKDAAIEAIEAGIRLLVLVPDRVPIYDVLEISACAKRHGAAFLGPNTLGCLSPGQGVLGMMGGRAETARQWFTPGPIGVISRSGGMTSAIAYGICRAGLGLSSIVHVGGDAVVGLPQPAIAALFQGDPQTEAVALFGEIGGSQEERVAEMIERRQFTKPLVAYIGGKAAKSGTRFSHAGAIVEGNRGTHAGKVARLRQAGATVVDSIAEIPAALQAALAQRKEAHGR